MQIREAIITDIPVLASHHRKMFEEILAQKGERLSSKRAAELENAYCRKLSVELKNGTCRAWVVEKKNEIVSSGGITLISVVPSPVDLSHSAAYLHSMYTIESYRNKKCAQIIIKEIIAHCKRNKIRRILLNTSSTGKPVYEKMGFRETQDSMRLLIK